jgi:hypothetical protein
LHDIFRLSSRDEKKWFFCPPCQSYPPQTDLLLSDFYRWAGDANTFTGDECIELVCSPNNPDGAIREAVVRSAGAKAIHDLVYYWPQYTPITGPAAHDIMLFSVSKLTGHAGTRLGYVCNNSCSISLGCICNYDGGGFLLSSGGRW